MRQFIRKIQKKLKPFGFDPIAFLNALRSIRTYNKEFRILKKQKADNHDFPFGKKFPIFSDRFSNSGIMSGHYFHQDLLVAKKIFHNSPKKHVDIGSRTDGFIAHLAVFREVEVLDIRYQESKVQNIIFKQADLMQLPKEMESYTDSISALHSIEHFGLGRYGDPIDYYGHEKGISNIYKILKPGGKFYFSSPIGKQRIEFNAHRVFSIEYLLKM